jgi:hypothetical protein
MHGHFDLKRVILIPEIESLMYCKNKKIVTLIKVLKLIYTTRRGKNS